MPPGKIVLHIDDNPDEQELFREALRQVDKNIIYRSAISGDVALRMLQAMEDELPDIIFLDLDMPRMGGHETLKALQASKRFKDIPVIIYTTSADFKDIEQTRALGATAFMNKHFAFDDMKAAIAAALSGQMR